MALTPEQQENIKKKQAGEEIELSSEEQAEFDRQKEIQESDKYQQQFNATRDGTPIAVSPKIVSIWNRKKAMNAIELSTLVPFAVVFIVTGEDVVDYFKKKGMLEKLNFYRARIKGLGKNENRVVIPLGATKSIIETTNFAGGLGISNFEIGYQKNLTNLTGKIEVTIPTLEEFEEDFVASALLSPFNILLTIHGWTGAGILMDLPWDSILKNGVWETKVESLNPGWWSMNTVYMFKRTLTPQGTSYSCELEFSQAMTGVSTTPQTGDLGTDTKQLASQFFELPRYYTTGTSQTSFEYLNDKSKLKSRIEEVYGGTYSPYINERIDRTWFTDLTAFYEEYSAKRKNEAGEDEPITDEALYPLGLALEAIIATHFDVNGADELMRIHYAEADKKLVPDFEFGVSDGSEVEPFTVPISSAFDIPLSKSDVETIFRKPGQKWKDRVKDILNVVPDFYRVVMIAGSPPNSDLTHTHIINFSEKHIDKEVSNKKKSEQAPNERIEMCIDYRTQNSLVGEVQYETSNLGLEKLSSPVIWDSLFGKDAMIDTDQEWTKPEEETQVKITETKEPSDKKRKFVFDASQSQGLDVSNTKLLARLFDDETPNRGFLIRALSQVLNVTIHGTSGLLPMQLVWVRGLSKGMNGKHVILGINEIVTPDGYQTQLRLGNLLSMKDAKWLQKNISNVTEPNQQTVTTSLTGTTAPLELINTEGTTTPNVKIITPKLNGLKL